MIYDTEVQFIQKVNSHYDPVLGEYVEEVPQINAYLANVTDLGLERSQKLFGEVKQGRKVIRLLPFQTFPDFDVIEIDGARYVEETLISPLKRPSLIVKQVEKDDAYEFD